jgi:Holliday junction resolvase
LTRFGGSFFALEKPSLKGYFRVGISPSKKGLDLVQYCHYITYSLGVNVASTPERKVKEKVVTVLKQHGAYYFFPATYGLGRAGIPDIIACHCGRFVAIECKAGKGTTTALQVRELDRIRRAGGIAMVINETNIDLVHENLTHIKDRENEIDRLLVKASAGG